METFTDEFEGLRMEGPLSLNHPVLSKETVGNDIEENINISGSMNLYSNYSDNGLQ